MSATNKETEQEHHFNAVYWEVEPYIYKDEHGKLAGRVISRLETTLDICGGSGTTGNVFGFHQKHTPIHDNYISV